MRKARLTGKTDKEIVQWDEQKLYEVGSRKWGGGTGVAILELGKQGKVLHTC